MEVAGICYICGQGAIVNTCSFCGLTVCDEHFVRNRRVCVQCKRGRLAGMPDVRKGKMQGGE